MLAVKGSQKKSYLVIGPSGVFYIASPFIYTLHLFMFMGWALLGKLHSFALYLYSPFLHVHGMGIIRKIK